MENRLLSEQEQAIAWDKVRFRRGEIDLSEHNEVLLTAQDTKTTAIMYEYADKIAKESIAANNKWWVEQIERKDVSFKGICYGQPVLIVGWEEWQSLKQSILEVKQ